MLQAFMPLLIAVAAAMIGLGMISPIFFSTYASAGGAELGPMFGRLSDRVGRRRMIALDIAAYRVVSILYVVEESLWELAFFRLLYGVTSVSVTPSPRPTGGLAQHWGLMVAVRTACGRGHRMGLLAGIQSSAFAIGVRWPRL